MAMYDVYSHPEIRRYRASICSKATIFMIFMYIFTFIIPILIIYRSNGLWITTFTTIEQPDIQFKHQVIAEFVTRDSGRVNPSVLTWSTIPQYNIIHQSTLRIPLVKSHEEDTNRDGRHDKLIFEMDLPVSEDVHKCNVILFFQYKLAKLSLVTMEAMTMISSESTMPGAGFTTLGELKIKQKTPIAHKGVDVRYQDSVVTAGSLLPHDYDMVSLFRRYSSRNLTGVYSPDFSLWTVGKPVNQRFKFRAEIAYPEETITYYTGFWQMFKYALVQYIAILILFAFLCERLKLFVFSQQIINTHMIKPMKSS